VRAFGISPYFADACCFLYSAHRFLWAAPILLRAAADIVRLAGPAAGAPVVAAFWPSFCRMSAIACWI
jgi:hypothetical protein